MTTNNNNKEEMDEQAEAIKAKFQQIHDKSLNASFRFVDAALSFAKKWRTGFEKAEEKAEESLDELIDQINKGETTIQKAFGIKGIEIPTVKEIKDSAAKLEGTIVDAAEELADEIFETVTKTKSVVEESIKESIQEVEEVLDVIKDKKDEKTEEEAKETPTETTKKPARKVKIVARKVTKKASPAKKTSNVEDLKLIKGIGPKLEELLKSAGIKNLEQFSKTTNKDLKAIFEAAGSRYKKLDVADFKKQAKALLKK